MKLNITRSNRRYFFLLALGLALFSVAELIQDWNHPQRWRFHFSLIGTIISVILFLASFYVNFIWKGPVNKSAIDNEKQSQ